MCCLFDCLGCLGGGSLQSICKPSEMGVTRRMCWASSAMGSCGVTALLGAGVSYYLYETDQSIAGTFAAGITVIGSAALSYVAYRYLFPDGLCGGCETKAKTIVYQTFVNQELSPYQIKLEDGESKV